MAGEVKKECSRGVPLAESSAGQKIVLMSVPPFRWNTDTLCEGQRLSFTHDVFVAFCFSVARPSGSSVRKVA